MVIDIINAKYKPSYPRKKLLEAFAENIIQYFDLENKLITDNQELNENDEHNKENSKCSVESLSNYFLNVYPQNKNMTGKDLDNLIAYQIKRGPKDNQTEYKTKRHICKRKHVIFFN